MRSNPKIPKDLGLVMGTKEEKAWTDIKERVELEIEQAKRAIMINQQILLLAEKMIKKEQR